MPGNGQWCCRVTGQDYAVHGTEYMVLLKYRTEVVEIDEKEGTPASGKPFSPFLNIEILTFIQWKSLNYEFESKTDSKRKLHVLTCFIALRVQSSI